MDKQVYVVGGAVRNVLLGLAINDIDFLHVGFTPQDMLDLGYVQVGVDFPVFLDQNGCEHALARTERKTGGGYTGYETDFNPYVTLGQDLERRDFTVNTLCVKAEEFDTFVRECTGPQDTHYVIDPIGGLSEIEDKVIWHVGNAFKDDPLRVLRAARFAAQLGFTIAVDTLWECQEMAKTSEFAQITPERVGTEMLKALGTDHPEKFFETLADMGCLHVHFPEIHALIGQTQPEQWHPEGDAFNHTMLVLKQAVRFPVKTRFAALVHDLGKGLTREKDLPHHFGHEAAGVPLVETMCDRLKLSNDLRDFAKIVTRYHGHVHNVFKMNPKTFVKVYDAVGRNNIVDLMNVGVVSICDARGRGPTFENADYPNAAAWSNMFVAINAVKFGDLATPDEIKQLTTHQIKEMLYKARVRAATTAKKDFDRHVKRN